ncbi:hypothetical protein [Microbacterium hominis]|uniref:Uncharacterized protein n=1 Tax=Microbacterium hominis TaxID=162426 RepID=A0A7D4U510_9MICO|nr:hypothetical protein [Microbacterium hominis]QKJ19845.1 hypothetical protein HQM25_11075 [Microbacterium hominis]
MPYTRARGRIAVAVLTTGLLVAMAGCAPETPSAGPTSRPAASSASPRPSTPAATSPAPAAPTATAPAATSSPPVPTGFAVPDSCDRLISASMRSTVEAQVGPLNDPGVTMLSTQNATALELLGSGIPTLRCTWGRPGEVGVSTTVSALDSAQVDAVTGALAEAGFGCEPVAGGALCRIEQRGVTLDDQPYLLGEDHFLRDGGWIATAWLNAHPEGYTDDIIASLWG